MTTQEEPLRFNGGWRKAYKTAAEKFGYSASWSGAKHIRISKDGKPVADVQPTTNPFLMSDLIKAAHEKAEKAKAWEAKRQAAADEIAKGSGGNRPIQTYSFEKPMGKAWHMGACAIAAAMAMGASCRPRRLRTGHRKGKG
jgi:antitoxin (DNA-binding transcriptional repressor) of toxin-antitoxin stability system